MVQMVTIGAGDKTVVVNKIAHGLMMMTWKPTPVPEEQAFAAIKAGIDTLPPGTKMMLNAGQFYGQNASSLGLDLVANFFEKYPDYADKAFLSVKGGMKPYTMQLDVTPEGLRRSVDFVLEKLRGKKKLDLFETARVDRSVPHEEQMKVLAGLVAEGKFDFIGLSEVGAKTVREANAVTPIAAVEIEVSPWSYEPETKEVISTCAELGIPVVAYSPLGRGFLTGQVTKPEDFEEGDFRRHFTRFQAETMKQNFALVDALKSIAQKKGITPAQLAIAWVSSRGPHVIPLPGSSDAKRTSENLAAGDVVLTPEDLAEIEDVQKRFPVQGSRYVDGAPKEVTKLWG
ncbi:aldo/keto reductase [Amylostereum chailletii]|nr:aldo/keto reductase [Amylostereum chailletii]